MVNKVTDVDLLTYRWFFVWDPPLRTFPGRWSSVDIYLPMLFSFLSS